MTSRRTAYRNAIIVGLCAAAPGCVQRVIHVRSDPPGAAVWLNDRQVGRTPFDKDFLWYGNYDVVARADGYQTLKTSHDVGAPWWQWIPLDLVTDLLPLRVDRTIDLKLKPQAPPDPAGTLARGERLKAQLESSEHTTHKNVLAVHPAGPATTRATTAPATQSDE